MKISELIALLEQRKEELGDIPVKQEEYGILWNISLSHNEDDNVLIID